MISPLLQCAYSVHSVYLSYRLEPVSPIPQEMHMSARTTNTGAEAITSGQVPPTWIQEHVLTLINRMNGDQGEWQAFLACDRDENPVVAMLHATMDPGLGLGWVALYIVMVQLEAWLSTPKHRPTSCNWCWCFWCGFCHSRINCSSKGPSHLAHVPA